MINGPLFRRVQRVHHSEDDAPNNVPVSQLVHETGISDVTLYTWRKKAVSQGKPVPGDGKKSRSVDT